MEEEKFSYQSFPKARRNSKLPLIYRMPFTKKFIPSKRCLHDSARLTKWSHKIACGFRVAIQVCAVMSFRKNISRFKLLALLAIFATAFAVPATSSAQTSLAVGDVSVLGFNANAPDNC